MARPPGEDVRPRWEGRSVLWSTELPPVARGRSPGMMLYSLGHVQELQRRGVPVRLCGLRVPPGRLARAFAQGLYLSRLLWGALGADLLVLPNARLAAMHPLLRLLGAKVLVICHDLPADAVLDRLHGTSGQQRAREAANKDSKLRALRAADAVVAVSETTAADLREQLPQLGPARVIPNSFALPDGLATYAGPAHRKAGEELLQKLGPGWPQAETVGLAVAALEARKNLGVLLDLVEADAGGFGLVLVGAAKEAGLARRLRQMQEAGLAVRHLESVGEGQLHLLRLACDLFLNPAHYEGFGRTALEAQASGLPVLASDIAAHREVLGEGALLVQQREDPQAWAQALARLAAEPELRARLVERGRANAARFTPQALAPLWEACLAELLGIEA